MEKKIVIDRAKLERMIKDQGFKNLANFSRKMGFSANYLSRAFSCGDGISEHGFKCACMMLDCCEEDLLPTDEASCKSNAELAESIDSVICALASIQHRFTSCVNDIDSLYKDMLTTTNELERIYRELVGGEK